MDRQDFLKKGLLGTGMFVASASLSDAMKNDIEPLRTDRIQSSLQYRIKNKRKLHPPKSQLKRKGRPWLTVEPAHFQFCQLL